MKQQQSYNGWTNYETWLVHLYITSTEQLYRAATKAKGSIEIRNLVEEHIGLDQYSGLTLDMILTFLSEVNWVEIYYALQEQ